MGAQNMHSTKEFASSKVCTGTGETLQPQEEGEGYRPCRMIAMSAVGLFNLSWLSADRMACQLTDADKQIGCTIHKASVAA